MVGKRLLCSRVRREQRPSRTDSVVDKVVGNPFQSKVGAARAVSQREGSESDEAEDYMGTSMAGVIRQCAVELSNSGHDQTLQDDGVF
jgi:hypothetical protein